MPLRPNETTQPHTYTGSRERTRSALQALVEAQELVYQSAIQQIDDRLARMKFTGGRFEIDFPQSVPNNVRLRICKAYQPHWDRVWGFTLVDHWVFCIKHNVPEPEEDTGP